MQKRSIEIGAVLILLSCAFHLDPLPKIELRLIPSDSKRELSELLLSNILSRELHDDRLSRSFRCFIVNVTGSGIPTGTLESGCTLSNDIQGRGVGRLSDTFAGNSKTSMTLAHGPQRQFDVYGLSPYFAFQGCSGESSNFGKAGAFLVGSKQVDINGPTSLIISIDSHASTEKSVSCEFGVSAKRFSPHATRHIGYESNSTAGCLPSSTLSNSGAPDITNLVNLSMSDSTNYDKILSQDASHYQTGCPVGFATAAHFLLFAFDVSAVDVTLFETLRVNVSVQSGKASGGCSPSQYAAATDAGTVENTVQVWRYNAGVSAAWEDLINLETLTNSISLVNGSANFIPRRYVDQNDKIWIRVVSDQTEFSNYYSCLRLDYLDLVLRP